MWHRCMTASNQLLTKSDRKKLKALKKRIQRMNNFDVAGDLQNEKSGMENQHKRIQQAKKKDFHTSSL
jgi:hypothetical protein